MKTATKVMTVLATSIALTTFSLDSALAASAAAPSGGYKATTAYAQQQLDEQLAERPDGVRTGNNELTYDGGNFVFTAGAVDPAAAAAASRSMSPQSAQSTQAAAVTGACPSGWFCVWEYSQQSGNRRQWKDVSVNQSIGSGEVHSLQNRRAGVTYIYTGANATGQRQCIPAGAYQSSVGAPYNTSKTLYNSTAAGC